MARILLDENLLYCGDTEAGWYYDASHGALLKRALEDMGHTVHFVGEGPSRGVMDPRDVPSGLRPLSAAFSEVTDLPVRTSEVVSACRGLVANQHRDDLAIQRFLFKACVRNRLGAVRERDWQTQRRQDEDALRLAQRQAVAHGKSPPSRLPVFPVPARGTADSKIAEWAVRNEFLIVGGDADGDLESPLGSDRILVRPPACTVPQNTAEVRARAEAIDARLKGVGRLLAPTTTTTAPSPGPASA